MLNQLNESQLQTLDDIENKTKIKSFEFSLKLEEFVKKEGVEYITALQQFCDLYDIEYENINKYLTEPIKQKIAKENGIMGSIYHVNSTLPV